MRVTQSMLTSNLMRNINRSQTKMAQTQEQLSTGKKYSRPSDNPVAALKGMKERSNITSIEQYQRNIGEMKTWFENSEAGVKQANDDIERVKELMVQVSNETYGPNDLNAVSKEIGQIKEDLFNIANTNINDRFIFNGTKTQTPPIVKENGRITVQSNNSPVLIAASKGIGLRVNINPDNVFNQKIFDTLNNIENKLKNGETDFDSEIKDLKSHSESIMSEWSELGAKNNRLEMMENRLDSQLVASKKLLSENEDVDFAKTITDLKMQESVHRAALSVGSRIIQPTLIDFLR